MAGPRCIVCGKPIAKKVTTYWFKLPRAAKPEKSVSGGRSMMAARPAIEAGTRIPGFGSVDLQLDVLPKTKADVQRLVNGEVLSVRRHGHPYDHIWQAGVWDGESYRDRFFCKDGCAVRQGYASAKHGARFVWEKA